ncbi:MAG: transporter substrate-binding domain-containing protein [Alphaproteobacteria bacterium]|nr:transporter substrate-binding domain-containing protein [Alphaproteobacteria bacterium]
MRLLALLVAAALAGGCARPSSAETLAIVGSTSVPVKSELVGGMPAGFAVEVAAEAARKAGFSPSVSLYPWERAVRIAREGRAVLAHLYWTPARAGSFDFTLPLYEDDVLVVTRRGAEFQIRGVQDLRGRRLAVQQGAGYGAPFEAALPWLDARTDNDPVQRLRLLARRDIDAALFNPCPAAVWRTAALAGLPAERFAIMERPLARLPCHMAVAKGHMPGLVERLNRAIESLRADGTIGRLRAAACAEGGIGPRAADGW